MGAYDFRQAAIGKTSREAFERAVRQAQYDHGHSGYSGTIAEKHSFVAIPATIDLTAPLRARIEAARAVAEDLIDRGDPRIDDKWGPAGCIDLGPTDPKACTHVKGPGIKCGSPECQPGLRAYLFFGWASS